MEKRRINLDEMLTISVGESRKSTDWTPKHVTWAELRKRFREPIRTAETAEAFARMSRDERARIKDVGGFVGGRIDGGNRKAGNVSERRLLALDADYGTPEIWDSWEMMVGHAALMHSTHSHTKETPRLRLLIPLSRAVTAEEYVPIARRVAEWLDIEAFDDTTYEANRLMYWPSCSSDGEYLLREMDGTWLDPDEVLSTYTDWHDMREWPRSSRQQAAIRRMGEKQGDPLTKPGVVGAFNRAYSISEAIEKYLPGVYLPCGAGRWTYAAGTSTGGAVSYDNDTFLFSHHDTDPTSGRLCSAYDLVRLHLFGAQDEGCDDEALGELPSTAAMKSLCSRDEAVRAELAEGIRRAPEEVFEADNGLQRFADDATEQGAAQDFVDRYGANLRYNPAFGWLFWDGMRWVVNAEAEAMMLAMRYADDAYEGVRTALHLAEDKLAKRRADEQMRRAVKLRTASGIKGLLTLARAIVNDSRAEDYDAGAWDLNTPEGIVDLRTGALRAHDPAAKCTKVTLVTPDGEGEGRWRAFLAHITGGDADFEVYLQTLAGMAAVGEVYEEGLLISHGSGGNGKSTFFGALRQVLGDYARGINADVLVAQNGRVDQSYVAALRGVRLAIMGETEEGAHFSLALMKRLTSRDTISARALYKDPIEFKPSHTIVMHTNHLPRLSSLDGGTKRRIAVAPFPATLPPERVITNFENVLVRECGGAILRWIVEGAMRFYAGGCKLEKPDCVQAATARYMVGEDWIGQFVADCCEEGEELTAAGGELYMVYRAWAERQGEYVRRNRDFAYAMQARGYAREKRKTGAVWKGVALRDDG